jgi:DNA-binding NtrC family response regulator
MLAGRRILLIEDDAIMGASLVQRLELEGAAVCWVKQVVRAIPEIRVARAPVDAVVCDIRLPDGTGEEIFTRVSATMTPPPFLFITGQGEIEQAVRLMRAGAADYVTKPFEMQVFLDRLVQLTRPRDRAEAPPMLGVSAMARQLADEVDGAAQAEGNILLLGGPGTGKAAIARQIHARSDRRAAPFVEVDLARGTDGATELLGADGPASRAGEGIVLLRAVDRMAPELQSALVAALDRGVEWRAIATATAVPSPGEVRPDLLARLGGIEIAVPPLRERTDDALWLLGEFFRRFNALRRVPLKGVSALAEEAARAHDWPGNGREVRARVKRGVEAAGGDWLFPADIFPELRTDPGFRTLAEARDAAERQQIVAALARTGGQVSEAARLLRISRTTLWERMQKFGI